MKKFFFLSFLGISLFAMESCKKTTDNSCSYPVSNVIAPLSEQQNLQDSLTAHGIQATMAPSGFFYKITAPGSGASATSLCSTVAVFYRGGFFNGKGFDSTGTGNAAVFQLGQVIAGWQKALPLIAKSGQMTLYIPPSLGYGPDDVKDTAGKVVIPGNSDLVFEVILADVQ
ncbi:MAG: FKBP-type peptidyl-prolyl cis-trans isomerase [Ginsengibacter sp.]